MPSAPLFQTKRNPSNLSREDWTLLKNLEGSLNNLQKENRDLVLQILEANKKFSKTEMNPKDKEALQKLKNNHLELLPQIAEKQAAISKLLGESASVPSPIAGPVFSF